MRHRWTILACLTFALLPMLARSEPATPETVGTPLATPVVFMGCDDLEPYFSTVAALVNENDGYVAVRSNPDGVFQVDSAEAASRVASLEEVIESLNGIAPPAEAAGWHVAFVDIVTWYRELASAPDMASYQRVVNQDKVLIPALSRAAIAGQLACGAAVWQEAYDAAFADR